MTNKESLANYKTDTLATILVYGVGICAFCKHLENCDGTIGTKGIDSVGCYEGIKEWLESEATKNDR